MDVTIAGDPIAFKPSDADLTGVSLEFAAFDGEVGTGSFPIPDPTGDIGYYDGRQFRVDEGSTLLTDGFIIDQDRERGTTPAGEAILRTFSVMDANALLDGFRISRSRSAETDRARVLAFAAADFPSWDTTMVVNANLVTMPAKKYYGDGGWTSELIPDTLDFTGKTLFVHDKAAGGRCLHYHTLNSGHACGLRISDIIADNDATTFYPSLSVRRQRTSVDLRNDIKGVDQAGRVSFDDDAASIARHNADGLLHEAQPSFEAASQADLDAQTSAYLASYMNEYDTYSVTIGPLDATALALIRVGDIINVTSTVLGLEDYDIRIAHMTLTVVQGEGGRTRPWQWMAALELGSPVRRRARVANKAKVDRVTHAPVGEVGDVGTHLVCTPVSVFGSWDPFATTPDPSPSAYIEGGGFGNSVTWNPTAGTVTAGNAFANGTQLDIAAPGPAIFASWLTGDIWAGTVDSDVVGLDEHTAIVNLDVAYGRASQNYLALFQFEHPVPILVGTRRATTSPPDPWDAVTTYSPGDVVWNDIETGWRTCILGNTNVQPTVTGGWATYWDVTATDVTLSDEYHWKFKIDAFANVKVWPATSSEPAFAANWGCIATGSTGTEVDYVAANLGESAATFSFQFDTVWSIANVTICAYQPMPVAYHWTQYGPVAPQETPDGLIQTFTIPELGGAQGGYVPGTLMVRVNGVGQNVTEDDPDAGTYILGWAPDAGLGDDVQQSWLTP